jgi:hypothetical protein
MPSASTISLDDGQSTPVSHDFAPRVQVGPENILLINDEADTSAGQMKLQLGFSAASSKRPTNRVKVSFTYPVEQTVDGVVRVAYTARFNGEVVLPEEMTQAQRDDMAAFIGNALSHATVAGYVSDLDPMF